MDGILINSEEIYEKIEMDLFTELKIDADKKLRNSFVGSKMVDNWTRVKKAFNLDFDVADFVCKESDLYLKCVNNGDVQKFDDAYSLMKKLYNLGYVIGIGTSSYKDVAYTSISTFGYDKFIKSIITCDEVKYAKPAPDIYLKVATSLDVDPKTCVVIEDSHIGIKSAKAANMKCIAKRNAFNNNYNGADLIVSDLTDITVEIIEAL